MGMSTHVVGIRPADERFKKMLAAYEACVAAGIEPPKSVQEFFNDERPDPSGVIVDLGSYYNNNGNHASVQIWREDNRDGFEIELDKLPDGIKIVRFYNSW